MKDDADHLRQMLEQAILNTPPNRPDSDGFRRLATTVYEQANVSGVQYNGRVLVEHWWHLARTGVIALIGESKPHITHGGVDYPIWMLTEHGEKLLKLKQESPHDPQRYVNAIKKRVSRTDDIVLTYVNEAVGAWSQGLYRSSAVMLGCACERLIEIVAEVIAKKATFPKSTVLATKLNDPNASISGIFADVRETLLNDAPALPRALKDRLDRHLSPIFDHARKLRNRTGHPTGDEVTSEDAQAGLLLFPGFYELADNIIQAL